MGDEGAGFDVNRVFHETGKTKSCGLKSIEEKITYLDGRVTVDSRRGGGCRVTITLPNHVATAREPAAPVIGEGIFGTVPENNPEAWAPQSACGKMAVSILLVDDHKLVRESLALALSQQEEFEVIGQAASVSEAIELAETLRPDVILMDVKMPVSDGIFAAAAIRFRVPETVIIELTMHSDSDTTKRMRDAGAVEVLSKSDSTDSLYAVIRQHTRG